MNDLDLNQLRWDCSSCTFLNGRNETKCIICGSQRPMGFYKMIQQLERDKERARERERRQKWIEEQKLKEMQEKEDRKKKREEKIQKEQEENNKNKWNPFLEDNDPELMDHNMNDKKNSGNKTNNSNNNNNSNNKKEKKDIKMKNNNDFDDNDDGWDDNDDDWEDDEDIDGNDWDDVEITNNNNNEIIIDETKAPEPKDDDYQVLPPNKLMEYQGEILNNISDLLSIENLEEVGAICRYYEWRENLIAEKYPLNPKKARLEIGLDSSNPNKYLVTKSVKDPKQKVDCWLCVTQVSVNEMYNPGCGHEYCHSCWAQYFVTCMEKGLKVIFTRCIEPKCKKLIPSGTFEAFLPYKLKAKYQEYLNHSFVLHMKNLNWCPGTNCRNAVKADFGSMINIACVCGHTFCFNCQQEAHLPCNCEVAQKWNQLNETDSQNLKWMKASSKVCKKCRSHIEKNQGCNHMTCRCGYEFCWLCMKEWKSVGGYGHPCHKPKEVIDEEQKANQAKTTLERYIHYLERFENESNSYKAAVKTLRNSESCKRSFLNSNKSLKSKDLQFITDALMELLLTKRVLQWSYCYGYWFKDKTKEKELFELQQGLLDKFSGELHEQVETRIDKPQSQRELLEIEVRQRIITLTEATTKYRKQLSSALSQQKFIYQKGL